MVGEGLQEHWRAIGGALKAWRRIGGGLEKDWTRIGGGWTPEVWPGYAPVWPGYAPVWGLCADLLEKCHYFAKMTFFGQFFLWGAQIACKSRRTTSHVFWLRRFTLSRASKTLNIEEIYRCISKILNFTPSGSVLNRFSVFR